MLVHFERWSHRYDEWIYWDSNRLRPLERPALRKEGLKDEEDFFVSSKPFPFARYVIYFKESSFKFYKSLVFFFLLRKCLFIIHGIDLKSCLKQDFKAGEEVLARWTDCRYYPAKIEAINKEGMCLK